MIPPSRITFKFYFATAIFHKQELKNVYDFPVYTNSADNIRHKYIKVKDIYIYLMVLYRNDGTFCRLLFFPCW